MHIYGVWPWEVPKWPWFWAEVAVNAWRDLATLLALPIYSNPYNHNLPMKEHS
jgi:hypothetical protein